MRSTSSAVTVPCISTGPSLAEGGSSGTADILEPKRRRAVTIQADGERAGNTTQFEPTANLSDTTPQGPLSRRAAVWTLLQEAQAERADSGIQEGPLDATFAPRWPQEGPKKAPRWAQANPKMAPFQMVILILMSPDSLDLV